MAYVAAEKILVLVYDTGNIDLYDTENGDVYNLAGFMNMAADATVNGIDVDGSFAYVSMNTGALAIDAKNKVLKDTYKINKKTFSVCFWGDYMYAATDQGIFRANKNGNLLTEANWNSYPLSYPGNPASIRNILTYKENFVFYQPGAGVFYQDNPEGTVTRIPNTPANVNYLAALNNELVLITNSNMYTSSDLSSGATSIVFSASNAISPVCISLGNNSTYWLACGPAGICSFDKNAGNLSTPLTINSPKRNLAFNMTFNQGKLAVVGGGRETMIPFWGNPGTLMVMEADGTWINADEAAILTAAQNDLGSTYINAYDFFSVVIDPRDKDHYFVASSNSGIYELRSDYDQKSIEYVKLYNQRNTDGAITSALPSNVNADAYVRMTGQVYDNENNLYVLNCHNPSPIAVYSSDNKWFNLNQIIPTQNFFPSQIYITRTNQIWVVNGGVHSTDAEGIGLFVFNSGNNISHYLNNLVDQDGNNLKSLITSFTCVVEDLNGAIWAGTNTGPVVFYNPSTITDPNNTDFNRCSRIKVPLNNGTDEAYYLLDGVGINTIAVDGANRKWIGTIGAGVFLVSPTGDEVIANFTTDNSPLLSNNINKIVINDQNGEVFIATDRGLISYTNLATEGAPDYSNVYAYPNPVRPDFIGDVVVTGLIKDSNVKITDLSGNVMYQGTSVGGRFSWNCRNRAGERVKTGVYLVMAAAPDGTQGVVTKIVVIK